MKSTDAVTALASLAHETRLGIFRLLVQAGQSGLPAGQISESLGVVAATLSFHLTHLRNAGLVEVERQGRNKLYRADYSTMGQLIAYLGENCCGGECELDDCPGENP